VGIEKRYLAGEGDELKDMFLEAALEAIEQAGVSRIDRLIIGCNTQPRNYPSIASDVAHGLKEKVDVSNCWCLDVQNGCPGGMAAVALACDSIGSGQAENVLAIGGDFTSRMVDWFDRNTCLLLGDAASAFVLTSGDPAGTSDCVCKILSYNTQTDYDSAHIMAMDSSLSDLTPFEVSRRSREAAKKAVRKITGRERIPDEISKEDAARLKEACLEIQKEIFPPHGRYPYSDKHYPYFIMAGAEVLEKIRRIVPNSGYLPALRKAGIGLDIFEKHGLLDVDRVSDIPSRIRKDTLKELSERYDLLIPHQANLRGHQNLSAAFRVPMNKLYSNIAQYANTSAAAVGIALYEALRKPSRYRTIRGDRAEIVVPRLDQGRKAVLVTFGSGTNVIFVVLERVK